MDLTILIQKTGSYILQGVVNNLEVTDNGTVIIECDNTNEFALRFTEEPEGIEWTSTHIVIPNVIRVENYVLQFHWESEH